MRWEIVQASSENHVQSTTQDSTEPIKPILGKDCPLTEDVLFNKRPEQLSVKEFIQLTNQVEQALKTIND